MNIVDLNVCRVCLNRLNGGISIFEDTSVRNKFQQCTDLKLQQCDGLPTQICGRCNARLKVAYEFKRQAIASDGHLRSFIDKINNQFNEVANTSGFVSKHENEENEILYEIGYSGDDTNNTDQYFIINKKRNAEIISESGIETQNIIPQIQIDDQDVEVEEIGMEKGRGVGKEADIVGNEEEECEYQVDDDGVVESSIDNNDDVWQLEMSNDYAEQKRTTTTASSLERTRNLVITKIVIDPLKPTADSQQQLQTTSRRSTSSRPKKTAGTHICMKCNKDFSTSSNLQRHLDTHRGLRPYQCTYCGKAFTQNGSLKKHLLIHTGERPYVCDVCGRGFTQHTTLIFHMRRHTGERPYKCTQCNRNFRIKDALRRHCEENHSDTLQKIHICSICNRGLKSKYSLQMHLARHAANESTSGTSVEKDNFKCEECNRLFRSKKSYEFHVKRHSERKRYKCEHCDAEFTEKLALSSHVKIHLEVRPYECHFCGKSFTHENLLNDHIEFLHRHASIINSNSNTYQCGVCKKNYKIKENLIQHLKTHDTKSQVKMYSCDDCGVAFDILRRYKLHRVNKHNEIITDLNDCYICNIQFISVKDLNEHLEKAHDNVDETCTDCDQHFSSKKLFENHLLEHQLSY